MSAKNRTGKDYKPNGTKEVARRLRQIKAGQLKVTSAQQEFVVGYIPAVEDTD